MNRIIGALQSILSAVGIKTIRQQILLLNLLLLLIGVGAMASIYLSVQSEAATINMAGRQRMLSQRLAKEALLVAQGVEQREVVDKTMALFEASHAQLVQGDSTAGINPASDSAVRAQLEKVNTLWSEYRKDIEAYLDQADKDYLAAIKDESPKVLSEMNQVVAMMEKIAKESILKQAWSAVILIMVILLSCLLIFLFVNNRLVMPLGRLSRLFSSVAEGLLIERLPDEKGGDETAQTSRACNGMLDSFSSMVNSVIRGAVNVGTGSARLGSAAQLNVSSMQRQYREIEQVSTAMNEMTATVQEVARNITQAAEKATEADQQAINGRAVMGQTALAIQTLNGQVDSVSGVINSLDADSQEIGKVLDVINGIAEQTNLLALNAAIEAARAGDQGRGFAVVADEVRALAARTSQSTQEIRTMIEKLQHQARNAVTEIETGQEQARTTVDQVTEADAALIHIAESVSMINEMNAQVATAAEQQSQVAEEMNRSIVEIAGLADRTRSTAEDNLKVTEAIAIAVENLRVTSAQFHTDDPGLQLEIAKAAHLAWKGRLRAFLDGRGGLTKEQAVSHHHCILGKWYYAEGLEQFGHLPEMQALEQPHAALHTLIKQIIELKESGHYEDAETAFAEIEPLSAQIVSLLDKIEECVST